MSGVLYAATMGGEGGFALGVGATLLAMRVRRRSESKTVPSSGQREAQALWDEPAREAVAAEFATHSAGVGRQLSEFADVLADGDPLLRERLRGIEQHMRREV